MFPIHTYNHPIGFSITGGYTYRGCDIPSLDGTYFFADYVTSRIWSFRYDGAVKALTERTGSLSPSIDGFPICSYVSFAVAARRVLSILDRSPLCL